MTVLVALTNVVRGHLSMMIRNDQDLSHLERNTNYMYILMCYTFLNLFPLEHSPAHLLEVVEVESQSLVALFCQTSQLSACTTDKHQCLQNQMATYLISVCL